VKIYGKYGSKVSWIVTHTATFRLLNRK
jgi:hypothetical protein